MAEPTDQGGRDREKSGGSDRDDFTGRLRDLDRKLSTARSRYAPAPVSDGARGSAMGFAFRIATEMVAGVVVGAGIGWGLDWLFGTRPWLFLVFLLLGMVAGILNVVRTAQARQRATGP